MPQGALTTASEKQKTPEFLGFCLTPGGIKYILIKGVRERGWGFLVAAKPVRGFPEIS